MASGNFPSPFLRAPRACESGASGLALAPRRAAPATAPAGDSFPLGDLLACIARTSRAKQASRVKKMVSWTFHSENSLLLAVSPSHLHPPRPSAQPAFPSPSRLRTSRRKLQRQLRRGCGCKASFPISQICKTLRSGESTEGFSARVSFPGFAWCGCRRDCENCPGLGIRGRAWRFVSGLGWIE